MPENTTPISRFDRIPSAWDGVLRSVLYHHDQCSRRHYGRLGAAYSSPYDLVLTHGQPYRPRILEPTRRGHAKRCFANAILAALTPDQHAIYIEGYALLSVGGQPPVMFNHAWVEVPDTGKAYELTWPIAGLAYLGIAFSAERAHEATWYGDGSVMQDAKRGYPLLQQPWVSEEGYCHAPADFWITCMRAGNYATAMEWMTQQQMETHDERDATTTPF